MKKGILSPARSIAKRRCTSTLWNALRHLGIWLVAFAVGGVHPIMAEGSGPGPAQQSNTLTEIVVTAQKRESTVQDTPISITAVSAEDIRERGLANMSELVQSVPGVSMRTSGPAETEFEMRGMSSEGGNSPTVGFYLDDVPLTATSFATNGKVVVDPNLYDLKRVEVLRGPQGTLYGSGSMGGTIKLVTNPPNPASFDASAEAILGHTDGSDINKALNAMVNIPFAGNTAALRIVGTESYTGGWIDRIVIADGAFPLETNNNMVRGNVLAAPVAKIYKNVNNTDLGSSRAELLWEPTERVSVTGSYLYQHISQNGPSYIDSVPGTNAHYEPFDSPEPVSDTFNLGSLNFRYRFDAFDVNSTTARWTKDFTYYQDGSEEYQWLYALPLYTSQGGLGNFSPTPHEEDQTKQVSEELRVTSSGPSALQWLAGYYYGDYTANTLYTAYAPGAIPLFGTANIFSGAFPTELTQRALFGESSYAITSKFKATVGIRYYSYRQHQQSMLSGQGATGSDAIVTNYGTASNHGFNPKFGLSYEPNDSLLLYTSAAKGFRPGGATGPIPTSGSSLGSACETNLQTIYGTTSFVPGPTAFGPDKVWTYELGEKMKVLANRLRINSSVYFSNWSGLQQLIPLPCSLVFTANAGDAHIYGGEVEFEALLGDGFTMSINGGYTHAAVVASGLQGVGISAGTPVQEVPKWTTSQSLAYRHGISNGLAFTARAENNYVGSRTNATFVVNTLPSYDLTSIRAGVDGGSWTATLFASNLLNKRVNLGDVSMISINLPTYDRLILSQPLTIGVDLTYHFGK